MERKSCGSRVVPRAKVETSVLTCAAESERLARSDETRLLSALTCDATLSSGPSGSLWEISCSETHASSTANAKSVGACCC
jgi:hypothetical protein